MESREFVLRRRGKEERKPANNTRNSARHSSGCLVSLCCPKAIAGLYTVYSMQCVIYCMCLKKIIVIVIGFPSLSFLQVLWASGLCHSLSFSSSPISYRQHYIKYPLTSSFLCSILSPGRCSTHNTNHVQCNAITQTCPQIDLSDLTGRENR